MRKARAVVSTTIMALALSLTIGATPAQATTQLVGVTIARNTILSTFGTSGLYAAANQTVSAYGSLLGQNFNQAGALSNCGGGGTVSDTGQTPSNIEDDSSCGFDTATTRRPAVCTKYASGDSEWCSAAPTPPAQGMRMVIGIFTRPCVR